MARFEVISSITHAIYKTYYSKLIKYLVINFFVMLTIFFYLINYLFTE